MKWFVFEAIISLFILFSEHWGKFFQFSSCSCQTKLNNSVSARWGGSGLWLGCLLEGCSGRRPGEVPGHTGGTISLLASLVTPRELRSQVSSRRWLDGPLYLTSGVFSSGSSAIRWRAFWTSQSDVFVEPQEPFRPRVSQDRTIQAGLRSKTSQSIRWVQTWRKTIIISCLGFMYSLFGLVGLNGMYSLHKVLKADLNGMLC